MKLNSVHFSTALALVFALSSGVATAEVPSSLKGLRDMRDRIGKRLAEMESHATEVSSRDVQFARIDVMSYFMYLYRGGTNAGECEPCKKHPLYAELKAAFPAMEARMAKLEHDQGCTYGYQMEDGKILKLDTSWTREHWNEIMEKSKHKQARCWMDNDRNSYL